MPFIMQKMRKESKPMKNNIVAEYDYYTLDQAREIVYQEMRHGILDKKEDDSEEERKIVLC